MKILANRHKIFVTILMWGAFSAAATTSLLESVSGKSLKSGRDIAIAAQTVVKKATVVVFLSAVCPCSNSHISVLNELAEKYKDFQFIGIHSNSDEPVSASESYFKAAALSFDVIQDTGAKLADQFRAFKTPHVFVVSPDGQIVYQGGVTNSSFAPNANRQFLAEALEDISHGVKVRTAEGRTLGCVIARERSSSEKNVW